MNIEKNIETCNLIDCYGAMLTEKQLDILKQYCFDDLSLSEIAENYNITRQAVNDIITRTLKVLNNYEEKLQFLRKKQKIKNVIKKTNNNIIYKELEKIQNILEE